MRSRFEPDHGLSRRMALVMFLLVVVYLAFAAFFVWLGVPWYWTVLIAVAFAVFQWYASGSIALRAMNARVVSPQEAPGLHAIVDRLVALADMPKPTVAIAYTNVPNAFATGRTPSNAVVVVTTGIMDRLDPQELEGVLAHELSHVAHRDVSVMTIASVFSVLAGIIAQYGLQMGLMSGVGRRRSNNDSNFFLLLMASVVVSAVIYALSYLLIRTLSRYRELAADRAGAILTGRPSQLASALVKVSGGMTSIPDRDLRAVEAYNAFFLVPALARGFSLSSMFATHPSLDVRLERLGQLAVQIGETS